MRHSSEKASRRSKIWERAELVLVLAYLNERVVRQAVVESAREEGQVLRAVHAQHLVQKPRTTRQDHRMKL